MNRPGGVTLVRRATIRGVVGPIRDPGHPDALVLPAFAADTAVDIRRVGAVLQIIPPVTIRAASRAADHSWSVLVSPHT
jgi:hypothetical protein